MKYQDLDDLDKDLIKAFADFSGLYKFLKVLAAVVITVTTIYFFNQ